MKDTGAVIVIQNNFNTNDFFVLGFFAMHILVQKQINNDILCSGVTWSRQLWVDIPTITSALHPKAVIFTFHSLGEPGNWQITSRYWMETTICKFAFHQFLSSNSYLFRYFPTSTSICLIFSKFLQYINCQVCESIKVEVSVVPS